MAIKVSQDVYEGILAVKDSGLTNMFDRPRVLEILDEMGFEEAHAWVTSNKEQYSKGIFQGFQVAEDAEAGEGDES